MNGGVQTYRDRTVFVTGHTGFKGAWLCEWLLRLGARVVGFSLPPPTTPALFDQLALAGRIARHQLGDIRDSGAVAAAIREAQPDVVFHLAAQTLVRNSYAQPVENYATNVMGTVHMLEALRALQKPCAAVFITTDKCYENREWLHGYREDDPLGGHDPYSSSKAAAEIAIASYRRSFFKNNLVKVASARAGNVIGGGDWALDRILPDCIRALRSGQPIAVRNPHARRPWQHVLEPLSGYLWLAACLTAERCALSSVARPPSPRLDSAFNFGPTHEANRTVEELVQELLKHWPGRWEDKSDPQAVHEALLLQLSIDKAQALLGWSPVWAFGTAIEKTVSHYRHSLDSASTAQELTTRQIQQYHADASRAGLPWAAAVV